MHQLTVSDLWNVINGVMALAAVVLPVGYAITHRSRGKRVASETGHSDSCICAACGWTEYRSDIRRDA